MSADPAAGPGPAPASAPAQQQPQPHPSSTSSTQQQQQQQQQPESSTRAQPQTNPTTTATTEATEQQTQATTPPPSTTTTTTTATATATTTTDPPNPPAPHAPAQQAPPKPGLRATRFQDVLDATLSHTLNKIAYDNFASCYPTVAARAPGTLKAVQRQMVDRLAVLCKKEFDSVLTSRNVVAKLNELEALISDAERRRDEAVMQGQQDPPIPPHTLPAEAVLSAHLRPHLAQQRSRLNARLQTSQGRNARLWADVEAQRREAAELERRLGLAAGDVAEAGRLLAEGPRAAAAEDVAAETREIEEMLAATAEAAAAGAVLV